MPQSTVLQRHHEPRTESLPGERPGRGLRAVPTEALSALVAGDVRPQVTAVAQSLPAAGYSVTRVRRLLDVAALLARTPASARRCAFDLLVFVLSAEAWNHVALIEALVAELGSVPMVAFTDDGARFVPRLQALGVMVVPRLPCATSSAGGQLLPAPGPGAGEAGAIT